MSTSGGATWKELDKSMDDGYAIGLGSLYQAGCAMDIQSANRCMAVYKSNDDGKTWLKLTLNKENGSVRAVAVDPRNNQVVFAGGQVISKRTPGSRLYKSIDAGSSWTEVKALSGKGTCITGISFDSFASNRLLAVSDSGVFLSDDRGATWTPPGQIIPGSCIVSDPGTKGRFFLGSSQGAWMSVDGGKSWNEINQKIPSRSIACMAVDMNNSLLYAGGATGGVMRLKVGPMQVTAGTK